MSMNSRLQPTVPLSTNVSVTFTILFNRPAKPLFPEVSAESPAAYPVVNDKTLWSFYLFNAIIISMLKYSLKCIFLVIIINNGLGNR